jgi:hypothetical protein
LAPEAVRWIAPACLVLQFVLLFFTWTGLFPGGTPALTQSAAGIAFGMLPSRAADLPPPPPAPKEGQEAPRTPFQYRTLPGAPLMLGYFLLLFAGFVVSLALAAAHFASPATKQQLPTWVPRLVAHRTMVIGGLTILAFLCLIFYVFPLHFPLEDRLAEQAADVWNDVNTHLAKRDPAALVRYPLVARTWAYTFSVLAALVGVLGALADLWLEKRGARPVPRVTADW